MFKHCVRIALGIVCSSLCAATFGGERKDSAARLFIGEKELLNVYQPKLGGIQARETLYRFPPGTMICDIEYRGDDLYVLTSNALYAIQGGVRRRDGLKASKLIWGIPVAPNRPGFRKLAWGPEGDLYFSMADPLGEYGDERWPDRWGHWTFFTRPDGAKVPYNGVGGVFRCKPDGSGLQVVAGGLRDPDNLYFDRFWRLYTRQSAAEIYVPPHAVFGWPRDKTSVEMPWRADLLQPKRPNDKPSEPDNILFEPYEVTEATPDKLWSELSLPAWSRRYRAHLEIARRGGDLLQEANKRLLKTPVSDPAFPSLIWLAAKSQRGSLHLISLVDHGDSKVREQALRALTEYPEQLHEEPILVKPLLDPDPCVQHAALLACFSPKFAWNQPIQKLIERGPACSQDSYLRQAATRLLAAKASRQQLENMCKHSDAQRRVTGVLAIGVRLTMPASTKILESHLPLSRLSDAYSRQTYTDGEVDLRLRGRVGQYTIAEHWKADMHTPDQELLFKLLRHMLTDEADTVRFQAAYFLALLHDARCEVEVADMLKNAAVR